MDPYDVLGVSRSASQEEIDAAYRTLCLRYHPDKHERNPLQDLAARRLAEINAAYQLLADTNVRAAFDAGRSQASSAGHTGGESSAANSDAAAAAVEIAAELLAQRRHEEALGVLDQALLHGGRTPHCLALKGLALLGLDRIAEAHFPINEALILSPENLEARIAMAAVLISAKSWAQARSWCRKDRATFGETAPLLALEAQVCAEEFDFPAADSFLSEAKRLAPDLHVVQDASAAVERRRGTYDTATKATSPGCGTAILVAVFLATAVAFRNVPLGICAVGVGIFGVAFRLYQRDLRKRGHGESEIVGTSEFRARHGNRHVAEDICARCGHRFRYWTDGKPSCPFCESEAPADSVATAGPADSDTGA